MKLTLLALSLIFSSQAYAAVNVKIDPKNEKWTISKYLIGMHAVYSTEPDVVYKGDSLARWAKKVGVGVFRYPGGTILHHWNWEKPSGLWQWDGNAPEENWMSLDEYLHFCKVSGATPLVGVNYNHYYPDSVDYSAASAARLVKYVKDKGFPGAFYYIGNEMDRHVYLKGIGNSARVFRQHSLAMKKVDPAIKVLYNWNFETASTLKRFMEIAGDAADGVDFHEKWPDERTPGSYEMWKKEVPLIWHFANGGHNNPTWRERIQILRQAAKEIGRPDMLMANIEYGIAPESSEGFNRFTMSLMLIDYLQELFIANYDLGAHWSNTRAKYDDGMLMNAGNKWRMNPVGFGWEFLGRAQGKTMIGFESDNKFVYGFAAKDATDEFQLYLINKTESPQPLTISFQNAPADIATWTSGAKTLVDGDNHWGVVNSLNISYDAAKGVFQATIPPISYNQILFNKSGATAIETSAPPLKSYGGLSVVKNAGKILIHGAPASQVTVTSLSGQVVFQKRLEKSGTLELGKESLGHGVFTVSVVSGEHSVSEKIVLQEN